MIEYFAHSPKDGYPAQTYAQHINGVLERTRRHASDAARYSPADGVLLLKTAEIAAVYHDLGKLDEENQLILSGQKTAKRLPLNHADAGAAFLLDDASPALLAAVSVAAHHLGFPDFYKESIREGSAFRDDNVKARVDAALLEYSQIHSSSVTARPPIENAMPSGDLSIFLRMLLSCLVDADHTDTASHYGKYPESADIIPLRPAERLVLLNRYAETLGKPGEDDERNRLRSEMYAVCRDSLICENIAACDAPVGSGKTTAVMAHLLAQASKRGLRRIFVVLPFTNIIQQSVERYRKHWFSRTKTAKRLWLSCTIAPNLKARIPGISQRYGAHRLSSQQRLRSLKPWRRKLRPHLGGCMSCRAAQYSWTKHTQRCLRTYCH